MVSIVFAIVKSEQVTYIQSICLLCTVVGSLCIVDGGCLIHSQSHLQRGQLNFSTFSVF